jgi:YHS domain-containing protein
VRVALVALSIALVIVALVPLLRPRRMSGSRPRPPGTRDQLVKDPVCGTYIVRSRAVSRAGAEGSRYFCSPECAGRFGG